MQPSPEKQREMLRLMQTIPSHRLFYIWNRLGTRGIMPGPAISALAFFDPIIIVFLASMALGIVVNNKLFE